MTWLELVGVASILTFIALHYNNILLSLASSVFWLVLWAYNLDHPPAGVVQGSAIHEWMTMGFVIVAMAVMFIWFRSRKAVSSVTGRITKGKNGEEGETTINMEIEHKGLLDMSEDEYRAKVRKALRRR